MAQPNKVGKESSQIGRETGSKNAHLFAIIVRPGRPLVTPGSLKGKHIIQHGPQLRVKTRCQVRSSQGKD